MKINSKLLALIVPALVFSASLFFSRWFWPTLTFPDGDSFYHLKITELLAGGLVRDFPWLPFTVLTDTYIDHHFLYHLFLFPFIKFWGPFVGAKIATVFLVAAALTVFYFILRGLKFHAPLFFTVLLFTAPALMFRLHLAKAPAFSLILFLLGLYFLWKQKPVALGILAFVYVWAYNLWPLLGFMVVVWILARSFLTAFLVSEKNKRARAWRVAFGTAGNVRLISGAILGTLAGIIFNPYFPANLQFYWHHIVQIGIINFQNRIGVGAEWYPSSFGNLLGFNALILLLFMAALAAFLLEAWRRSAERDGPAREDMLKTFGIIVLAGIFFVLTLRSRRMVEYFLPLAVMATAALTTLAWPTIRGIFQKIPSYCSRRYSAAVFAPAAAAVLVAISLPVISFLSYREIMMEHYAPDAFDGPMQWLREHAPSDSAVFHSRWDHFPMFFYGDDRLRYITGLDSTFFYVADPDLYASWRAIKDGEYAGDVVAAIIESFGARYALVTGGREQLFSLQLELSPRADLVYEDELSKLFQLYDWAPSQM